jgi:hypothetical protein
MNAGYLGPFWLLLYLTMWLIIDEWHGEPKDTVDISRRHSDFSTKG